MNYAGKLYGRITEGKFFDTGHTTKEWDEMVEKINHLTDPGKMIEVPESINALSDDEEDVIFKGWIEKEREKIKHKEAMLKGWMASIKLFNIHNWVHEKTLEKEFEKWYNEQHQHPEPKDHVKTILETGVNNTDFKGEEKKK